MNCHRIANMKADQERVKTLLTDTVSLLCKNGLQFSKELKVQGLLGITLDNDDVFVVHINEIFGGLLGAQLAGVHSEDNSTSAIAAADSATSDVSLKAKKGGFSKACNARSPNSGKRKIAHRNMSPVAIKIKKESPSDEDLVILDAKSIDSCEFNVDDGSGEGDREAMRKSYGEALKHQETTPSKHHMPPDSVSESFEDDPAKLSGMADDVLEESSQGDESRLSDMGQSGGQLPYGHTAGCSTWDSQSTGTGTNQTMARDLGSQDSIFSSPVVMTLMQQGLLQPPPGGSAGKLPGSVLTGNRGNKTLVITPHHSSHENIHLPSRLPIMHQPFGSPSRKYRPKSAPNKPWACPIPGCNLSFYEKRTMTRHIRYKHSAENTENFSSVDSLDISNVEQLDNVKVQHFTGLNVGQIENGNSEQLLDT